MLTEKVTFSLPCLKSLVNSDTSCVYCKSNLKRTLMILPLHLNDLKQSVREILASKVTTYDIELGGIILSHKNVKINSSVEMSDEGHFRLDCIADVYLFTPQIGSILSGKINKKGRDVLGCLVHSIFNVALPRPRTEEDNSKSWIGAKAYIGQTVTFSVVKLDFTRRLPYIRGQLVSLEDNITDDEGDSGMGYQKSIENCYSSKSFNDNEIKNEPSSLRSTPKRKRQYSDCSSTDSPKIKKERILMINSSDEGLSEEELSNRDTLSDIMDSTKKTKKERLPSCLKINKETSDNSSKELKKSAKKKKEHTSFIPCSDSIENLSSSLLAEAIKERIGKPEKSSLEITQGKDSESLEFDSHKHLGLYGEMVIEKKKVKTQRKSSVGDIENLSKSLLKEMIQSNQSIGNDNFGKKKKKEDNSNNSEIVYNKEQLKVQATTSKKKKRKLSNDLEEIEIKDVLMNKKKRKESDDSPKELKKTKIISKQEDREMFEDKKKNKKNTKIQSLNEISTSLLDQAVKDMTIKLENLKEEQLSDDLTTSGTTISPKKKKGSKIKTEKESKDFNVDEITQHLLLETLSNSKIDQAGKSKENILKSKKKKKHSL